MRKEAQKRQSATVAHIQGYHQGGYSMNYAFAGFTGNWYFNSDRKEAIITENGQFTRSNGQPFMGYGLEIETECSGVANFSVLAEVYEKIIFPAFKFGKDMFKLQHDGSLGGDSSAEVITQIMTKSRIRNDYAAYHTMFNTYFKAFGISADSYNTSCGMHVNISNGLFGKTETEQSDNIRKLFYIVNKHYKFCCKLFYRDPRKSTWCGRMDYSNARNFDLYNAPSSHGNCMNLSHFPEGRIEIRLVGGQKDYYCFRNTMECVFFLVERVKTLKWEDLDNLAKIFKGCNQYVYKRIDTECRDYISIHELVDIERNVKTEDLELHR